jgi:hypothetical protein
MLKKIEGDGDTHIIKKISVDNIMCVYCNSYFF